MIVLTSNVTASNIKTLKQVFFIKYSKDLKGTSYKFYVFIFKIQLFRSKYNNSKVIA